MPKVLSGAPPLPNLYFRYSLRAFDLLLPLTDSDKFLDPSSEAAAGVVDSPDKYAKNEQQKQNIFHLLHLLTMTSCSPTYIAQGLNTTS